MGYDSDWADIGEDAKYDEMDATERMLDDAIAAQKAAGNNVKEICTNSVFTSQIQNLASPQKSWLFEIDFKDGGGEGVKIGSTKFPVMKISMPKVENKTIERWYKGTKKTFVINQDRSGTTDIEIQLRSDMSYNASLINKVVGPSLDLSNFRHTEYYVSQQWKQLDVTLCADVNGEATGFITFFNPIITNVSFSDLSYSSSDAVTMTITIHYDWWINHEAH